MTLLSVEATSNSQYTAPAVPSIGKVQAPMATWGIVNSLTKPGLEERIGHKLFWDQSSRGGNKANKFHSTVYINCNMHKYIMCIIPLHMS
eukprot:c41421_g1_i1 orf=121-390(+)